ncbi:TadE-like protein [Neorhodopirellula lusitana]|uniref:TadE-like protein n=1 Tax=Neorhodopirellula lusitana TaxID=445327 RepID=A0ABY1PYL6_9BACT|nr:TadE family protein [Neorhodopirellula lusitana]SMP48098.1 TadE-like protein [Neorhodopirellula lusitana]
MVTGTVGYVGVGLKARSHSHEQHDSRLFLLRSDSISFQEPPLLNAPKPNRHGTALVELAICMPVFFLIVFASIEACNMIAMKQIICESAYEGALVALKPNATESDVVSRVSTSLAARGVKPSGVYVTGENGAQFSGVAQGEIVTVKVDASTDKNAAGPQLFGLAKTLSSSLSAVKQ